MTDSIFAAGRDLHWLFTKLRSVEQQVPAINRNAPYCTAFHTALCVDPDKRVRPCCEYQGSLGNLQERTLTQILGSAEWKTAKETIERGETPAGCQHCKNREEATGWSVRKSRFDARHSSSIGWSRGITQLELNTTNVCNLMCTHCSAAFSSRWVELKTKTGDDHRYHNFGPLSQIHPPNPANLVQQISALDLSHLEWLTFKGGEPMLNKDVPAVLEYLDEKGILSNLLISLVSNGSVVNRQVLDLLRRARRVSICLSVDGVGELQRYIRRGPSENERIEEFVDAFATLPTIQFSMSCSLMVYNVFSLDRITEWWNRLWAKYPTKVGRHSYGLAVIDPAMLSVSVLQDSTRRKLAWKYRTALGANYSAVIQLLKQPFGGCKLHNDFVQYTRDNDQLWNSNVLDVVPELAAEMVLLEPVESKPGWKFWSKTVALAPEEILSRGIGWGDAGQPQAALRLYKRFLATRAGQKASAWQVKLHRAILLAEVGEWQECLNAFREGVHSNPQTAIDLLAAPGSFLQEQHRPQPALKRLLEGPAQFRLLMEGLAYLELHDSERAATSLEKALELDPSFEVAALARRGLVTAA